MALNWAKLVSGEKVPNAQLESDRLLKEQQRAAKELQQHAAKEQQQRLKLAQEAPLRERLATKGAEERAAKERREAQIEANYIADHTKEKGYLGKCWPSHSAEESILARLPDRLNVPRTVNQKALNWVENYALPSWWENWTAKCQTIGTLKQAFCDAFVPWVLRMEPRGYWEFETFEQIQCFTKPHYFSASIIERANERQRRAELPNAIRYTSMLEWVQLRERDAKTGGDVPYGNQFWVTCKNITFENCLWAMNVQSETFRALDKDDQIITGFLKVNGNPRLDETTITWLADFSKYVPIIHLLKEKSAQAKARTAEKTRFGLDNDDDDY